MLSRTLGPRGLVFLAALILAAVLVPVLAWQKGLVAKTKSFAAFRLVYLAATLGFVGWTAQAQLSIVTVVGLVRAATTTHDFAFLLYDPVSLLIWAFTLATLVAWGRGTQSSTRRRPRTARLAPSGQR